MDITSGSAIEVVTDTSVLMAQIAVGVEKLNTAQTQGNILMGIIMWLLVAIIAIGAIWGLYQIIKDPIQKYIS